MIKLCANDIKLNRVTVAKKKESVLILRSAPKSTGIALSSVMIPTLVNPINKARVAVEL